MENNLQDPPPSKGTNRLIVIVLLILAIGAGLYFAGRYIYGLGQHAAAEIYSVELTVSATFRPTETMTPTITPTFTVSPTSTSFFPPTATPTKIPWSSCPGIVVTVADTEEGDMIHILRCSDSLEYDIGPLPKGYFAVSPDEKYFVYGSISGVLYAARIGTPTLTVIKKVNKEFYTFGRQVNPIFVFTFTGESPYVLEVYESRFGQNMPIRMPGWLTSD